MSFPANTESWTSRSTVAGSFDDAYISTTLKMEGLPKGWTMYVHPHGWVYFRNEEYKLVLNEDIRDPDTFANVGKHCLETSDLPDGVEACLLGSVQSAFMIFIDHNQCTADYRRPDTASNLTDMTMPVLMRRRRLYWNYILQHPVHITIRTRAFTEAVDALRSFYLDHLMNGPRSLSPFSKEECSELLRILDTPGFTASENATAATALLAWILTAVYGWRKSDRYGSMTYLRLQNHRDAQMRSSVGTPTAQISPGLVLKLLYNGPCFGIPHSYLADLKKASEFRGRLAGLRDTFEAYTEQLTREYSNFILVSTVLLSATMGLLAVPGIGQAGNVFALVSVYTSLGSISVGAFLIWRHQRNIHVPSSHTFAYIHNARNNTMGLPGHALLLSLPPVLLVWSLFAFTVGVGAYTLQPITGGSSIDVASAWIVFGAFVIILICVLAGLYTFSIIWKWQTTNGISGLTRVLRRSARRIVRENV
ncbi:hypothetical protein CERSUDRAFT_111225 [Gelatoporia subvermispora B]|uniref:WW domain-containing protein n=1 Tax=Ceriporiopsis subvermispora (strain B) TaxID=914234 RepID=M2RQB7_CERS8|nr:hypothetical protein CERSUDRAFT_111225 [Gelatoporia subvermispora B]